jgi:DNA end-binding protein Ku
MPRAIWSGSISFGLVNVPVRMYSAIEEQDLHFHYVHAPDGSRIGYEKVCKEEGRPVPDSEIVRAFEWEKDQYVYMSDEDFEAAAPEAHRTIDIKDFVPYEEIDPIYFERTYYLGPDEGGERVYALLLRAMEDANLAGIAKYVMRSKQHLGCLRIREGAIALEKMFFADEIRPVEEIAPAEAEVDERELEMARRLVASFSGHFDITKYEDTYHPREAEGAETAPAEGRARAAGGHHGGPPREPRGGAGQPRPHARQRQRAARPRPPLERRALRVGQGGRHPRPGRHVQGRARGRSREKLGVRFVFWLYVVTIVLGLAAAFAFAAA